MTEEKRRFTRIPFRVKVEIKANDVVYTTEEINNISIGGCLLPIAAPLAPGTSCRIKIKLGGTSEEISIRVKGEIVRSSETNIVVKFVRIDPDSLFHLQNIIRYNAGDADRVDREISEHPGLV